MRAARPNPLPRIDPTFAEYPLRIATSPIHRWGVFAVTPIPRGRKVIEYAGERVPAGKVLARIRARLRPGRPKHVDIFLVNRFWSVDPAVGGSGAERINHSCDPNLRARIIRGHIFYFSRRRIRPGEELSVDYRLSPDTFRIPCRCGSPKCRGFLNIPPAC